MACGKPLLWGIVLAGGEGERLRGFIREILGTDRPKQFCAFCGQRTMIEQNLRQRIVGGQFLKHFFPRQWTSTLTGLPLAGADAP